MRMKNGMNEDEAGCPAPQCSTEAQEISPPVWALAAVCLIIFALFFFLKEGPEEPPPGQIEMLATQEQAAQTGDEARESVTPAQISGQSNGM